MSFSRTIMAGLMSTVLSWLMVFVVWRNIVPTDAGFILFSFALISLISGFTALVLIRPRQ